MGERSDENGQPRNLTLNRARRAVRDVDELLGICRGLIADKRLNQLEAEFIHDWLKRSSEAKDEWPGDLLYARLGSILRDGRVDPEEEGELLRLLIDVTGGKVEKVDASSLTAGLPLTAPPPPIEFPERRFCFTGKFIFGARRDCEGEVMARGGRISDNVVGELDYLVIGVVGSRDWIHSSFGRKIEKAVSLRAAGRRLAIVGEQQFVSAIRG